MALHIDISKEKVWAKFDKVESPFVREFNDKNEYKAINKVNEGYDWCFGNKDALVTEKLNGTNSAFMLHKNSIIDIFQRDSKSKVYRKLDIYEGNHIFILAGASDYIARYKPELETFHAGETIGRSMNGNPYELNGNMFIEYKIFGIGHLPRYEFKEDEYPADPDLEMWRTWLMHTKSKFNGREYVEGIVFWNKRTGEMAKLRRNMF